MDLATPMSYRALQGQSQQFLRKIENRKRKRKLTPNYDGCSGLRQQYFTHGISYADIPYNQYRTWMLGKMVDYEQSYYKGMIVNRGGHPKTNTTETRYKHLRRMIKDGLLKMEKRKVYGYQHVSVLVRVK
jgi:glutathione peroxidase-family protein